MENQVHIIPKNLKKGQKYDANLNSLVLKEEGSFDIAIKELDDLRKKRPIAPKTIPELSKEEYNKLGETARWNYDADSKQYKIDLKKYNEKLKLFNERLKKFDTLNWTWELVYNQLDPNKITPNTDFAKGIHERITFPKLLEGGGIAWLEAWHEQEKPKGKAPFGMYVQAEGTPSIIRTEWTDLRYETLDKTTTVAFGSKVLLHIYTSGLYGQEVEIHLVDEDIFTPNDKLKIVDQDFFTREVKVHKLKPNDLNKKGIAGVLTVEKTHLNYAQKIELEVAIDKAWIDTAGKKLSIFPIIKSIKTDTFFTGFDRSHLNVSTDKESIMLDQQEIPYTNMPLIVGDVETNVATFQHCRYDSIKLNGDAIFDSSNIYQRIKNTISIDVIAGKKKANLLDFDFQTEECENKPAKHINKELTILSIPNEYELKVDASSKAEHQVKKEEEKKLVKTESKSSASISYMGGLKASQNEGSPKEKGIISVKQNQIAFDSFYNYDIAMDSFTRFIDVAKYFWLDNLEKNGRLLKIKALAKTCAFQQNVNITIYPDIKWSLIFGFNVEEEQLKTLIPSWDQEKTIKKFSWDGNKFTDKLQAKLNAETDEEAKKKIQQKLDHEKDKKETLEKINKTTLDTYKKVYGEAKPAPNPVDKPNTKKGKLSTLLKIMQDVDVSLKAQIYEDTELELTRDFFENAFNSKIYKDIYEKLRWAIDMLDGKLDNPQNKAQGDAEINALLDDAQARSRIKGLEEALTRSSQETEILFPKFTLGGDWQYEAVDAVKYPDLIGRSGLGYNVAFKADPLIGIKITWHILDLLCRRHPIAYAVLAAVKTLMAALGDNPDGIVVDFWVQGQISTDLQFSGNALAGDKKITAKGDAHITAGVEISITIIAKVVKGKYEAVAEMGVGAKGEVGLGIINNLGVDSSGIWMQSSLAFDGIKLTFTAVIGAKLKKNRVKEDGTIEKIEIVGGESKVEIEITMLAHTFESDKFYLS